MFEFHGWATIRVDDSDDADLAELEKREDAASARIRILMQDADDQFSWFQLQHSGNGLLVLVAHGLRNHRYEPVIELYRRVCEEFPDSYGLLHVFDDEDRTRLGDNGNVFRVWRLARGRFDELADPFLSPYFPTVEAL